ncbi:DUF6671 family protein [Aquirufa sp. ROCK-SH2]
MDKLSYFEGRKIVIATMHQKELVIGPALNQALNMPYCLPVQFNTDQLGTFTGEIERTLSPLDAARKKCEIALELSDAEFAIASEGSFGAHPDFFFLPADEEYLVLKERKTDVEIIVKSCSLNTNFGTFNKNSEEKLEDFLDRVKFPSHALIVKNAACQHSFIKKGIKSFSTLQKAIDSCNSQFGEFYITTDMRAMHNPTRMEVIRELTEKLIDKMRCCCPHCKRPGFSISEVKRGLECSQCSRPTKSVKTAIYTCSGCQYTEFEDYPEAKKEEDPMYCDYCNP